MHEGDDGEQRDTFQQIHPWDQPRAQADERDDERGGQPQHEQRPDGAAPRARADAGEPDVDERERRHDLEDVLGR